MAKILIADDDLDLAETVELALEIDLYTIDKAGDGKSCLELLDFNSYDLLILDVGLPDISGFDVCRQVFEKKQCPRVLLLTGNSSIDDKITGLSSGADDYLTKPFQVSELRARVRALLSRRSKDSEERHLLVFGDIELDQERHIVKIFGRPVELMRREFQILTLLMEHSPPQLVTLSLLVKTLGADASESSARLWVHRLKQKLLESEVRITIENQRGRGYRLTAEAEGKGAGGGVTDEGAGAEMNRH